MAAENIVSKKDKHHKSDNCTMVRFDTLPTEYPKLRPRIS